MSTDRYTWWTLSVGMVNHALNDVKGTPDAMAMAVCGREAQFTPGFWQPRDKGKRACRNCEEKIKNRAVNAQRLRRTGS